MAWLCSLWEFVTSSHGEALGSILSGVFTALAVGLAIYGYNRWKEELRGKAEHDAALRVLGETYRVREVFRDVRASQEEAVLAARAIAAGREETDVQRTTSFRDDYYRRLALLESARNDLAAAGAYAVAACGAGIQEKLEEVFKQVRQLPKTAHVFWYEAMILSRMSDKQRSSGPIEGLGAQQSKVNGFQQTIYSRGNDETDQKLAAAVKQVEEWAEEFLGRKNVPQPTEKRS